MSKTSERKSNSAAFVRGVFKGLGAPMLMYGAVNFPPMPELVDVKVPSRADSSAMLQDWQAVGDDIRQSIQKFRSQNLDEAASGA